MKGAEPTPIDLEWTHAEVKGAEAFVARNRLLDSVGEADLKRRAPEAREARPADRASDA